MRAVGIHVFAGGFTYGVKKVCDVACQLEIHNFGRETCEDVFGTEFINCSNWRDWPDVQADFAFGNPRCTAFSCITKGELGVGRGPFAKQTVDIVDLSHYSVNQCYPVIIWESVQQAFTTGRPLIDKLRDELYLPHGYKIAHVLLNAATFGNAQRRRRYFFVAYLRDLKFNCTVPTEETLVKPQLRNAIGHLCDRQVTEHDDHEYGFDSVMRLTPDEKFVVPSLNNHECLNTLARRNPNLLPPKFRLRWDTRESEMPFSLHCVSRLKWERPSPTLHGGAGRFIHPDLDRPLTVGELATIMGWEGHIPKGKSPVGQIAKGVCPEVGTWLATQAKYCLENRWDEDLSVAFDHRKGQFVETQPLSEDEKIINLTRYTL